MSPTATPPPNHRCRRYPEHAAVRQSHETLCEHAAALRIGFLNGHVLHGGAMMNLGTDEFDRAIGIDAAALGDILTERASWAVGDRQTPDPQGPGTAVREHAADPVAVDRQRPAVAADQFEVVCGTLSRRRSKTIRRHPSAARSSCRRWPHRRRQRAGCPGRLLLQLLTVRTAALAGAMGMSQCAQGQRAQAGSGTKMVAKPWTDMDVLLDVSAHGGVSEAANVIADLACAGDCRTGSSMATLDSVG